MARSFSFNSDCSLMIRTHTPYTIHSKRGISMWVPKNHPYIYMNIYKYNCIHTRTLVYILSFALLHTHTHTHLAIQVHLRILIRLKWIFIPRAQLALAKQLVERKALILDVHLASKHLLQPLWLQAARLNRKCNTAMASSRGVARFH